MARLFAAHGASVGVIGLSESSVGRTVELIRAQDGDAVPLVGDATDEDACAQMIRETAERYGRLDIVVNNIARFDEMTVDGFDEALWMEVIRVNLSTPLRTARAAAPYMRASGGGSIVNVGSIAGSRSAGGVGYGATKGALEPLTRDMAMTLGPDGIRVNCIVPGHLHTPHVGRTLSAEARRIRAAANMLGVEGTGWDVAWAALFLASDESRFITAQSILVDAGATGIQGIVQAQRLKASPADG